MAAAWLRTSDPTVKTGDGYTGALVGPRKAALQNLFAPADGRALGGEEDLHDVAAPLAGGGRLDVLFDRLDKRLPFVVHDGRWVVIGDILPLIPLPDLDERLSATADAHGAVGADDLGIKNGRAVGEGDRDGDAGEAVFVTNQRGGGVVSGLIVGAGADAGGYGHGLGGHQPGEAVDDVDAVGRPHAAAVETAAVLGSAMGVAPVLG